MVSARSHAVGNAVRPRYLPTVLSAHGEQPCTSLTPVGCFSGVHLHGAETDFCLATDVADAADKRGFLITPEDELRELMGKVRLDARVQLEQRLTVY